MSQRVFRRSVCFFDFVVAILAAAHFFFSSAIAANSSHISQPKFRAETIRRVATLASLSALSAINVPPSISIQPLDVVAHVGDSIRFSVLASGGFPLSYQWVLNGVPILGATDSGLSVSGIKPADAATFQVIVTNPFGSVTSARAQLTVIIPLLITREPTNQIAKAGADVTFVVQATSQLLSLVQRWNSGNRRTQSHVDVI